MNDDFDLVGAMLGVALYAMLLVAGQQYLLKHLKLIAAASVGSQGDRDFAFAEDRFGWQRRHEADLRLAGFGRL